MNDFIEAYDNCGEKCHVNSSLIKVYYVITVHFNDVSNRYYYQRKDGSRFDLRPYDDEAADCLMGCKFIGYGVDFGGYFFK